MPMQIIKGLECRKRFDATLVFDFNLAKETEGKEYIYDSDRCGKRFDCPIDVNVITDYTNFLIDNISGMVASLDDKENNIAIIAMMDKKQKKLNSVFLRDLQNTIIIMLHENELNVYLLLPEWVTLSNYAENCSVGKLSNVFLNQVLSGVFEKLASAVSVHTSGLTGDAEKIEKLSQIIPAGTAKELREFIETEQKESFYSYLKKEIDKRGMKEVECYKKANISRKLFWKIKNQPFYKPSKQTVAAFAIALKMDLKEAEELLGVAGYSLTGASLFDMILKFHIKEKKYDIYEINNVLYDFDQCLLGG